MNIHEIRQKIKGLSGEGRVREVLLQISLILLVSGVAFGLGRLSVLPEHKDIPYVNIFTQNAEKVICPKGKPG